MIPDAWRRTALTLTIGAGGAAIAALLGLPVAPLIGAALATSAFAWAGLPLGVDTRVRDAGFLIIGLSLGSGFTADILAQAGDWLLSLGFLFLSILVTMALSQWLLRRIWGQDRRTALLASSPGTMSLALSIAAEGRGDATAVTVIQTMRLLLLAAVLPLLIAATGGTGPETTRAAAGLAGVAITALAGAGMALALERAGLPAAFLIGGMIASAVAHAAGWLNGFPPHWLLFAGFCVTGTVVGSRFSGIGPSQILRLSWQAVLSVGAAALVSAVFAMAVSRVTGLGMAQVWVAFAPGGVEAMAAIGLALGFDPAYVALHHLVRIAILVILLPVWIRR